MTKWQIRLAARVIAVAVWVPPSVQGVTPAGDQALAYTITGETIDLFVPSGGVHLLVPKGALAVVRPAQSGMSGPRFFDLTDPAHTLEVSGWFEAKDGYAGIHEYFKKAAAAGDLPSEPREVEFTKVGSWEAVLFKTADAHGAIREGRVQILKDLTWIDVHVAVRETTNASDSREALLQMLRELEVRQQ